MKTYSTAPALGGWLHYRFVLTGLRKNFRNLTEMLYSRAQDRPVKTSGYIRLPPWMHCICQDTGAFPQNCRPWCWHWISLPWTCHAATRWGHFCGSASSRHWDNPPRIQWVLWSLASQPLQVLLSSWFGRCVRCRLWMDAHRFIGHGLPFSCKIRQFHRITKRFLKFCRIRDNFSEVLSNKKYHHIIFSVNKRC